MIVVDANNSNSQYMISGSTQVEAGKVLAPSRQPVKPILVHSEEENKTPLTVTEPLKIVRSNSFREIKPKDEVSSLSEA